MDTVRFWNWLSSYHTSNWHLLSSGHYVNNWKLAPWLILGLICVATCLNTRRSYGRIRQLKQISQQFTSLADVAERYSAFDFSWQLTSDGSFDLYVWPMTASYQQKSKDSGIRSPAAIVVSLLLVATGLAWSCLMMVDSLGSFHQLFSEQTALLFFEVGMVVVGLTFGWKLKKHFDLQAAESSSAYSSGSEMRMVIIEKDN